MKIFVLEGHWNFGMSEVVGVFSTAEKARKAIPEPKDGRYEEFCIFEAELDSLIGECSDSVEWVEVG